MLLEVSLDEIFFEKFCLNYLTRQGNPLSLNPQMKLCKANNNLMDDIINLLNEHSPCLLLYSIHSKNYTESLCLHLVTIELCSTIFITMNQSFPILVLDLTELDELD